MNSMKEALGHYFGAWSRRDLFKKGSVLAAAPAFFGRGASAMRHIFGHGGAGNVG